MGKTISNFISFAILAGGASKRMGTDKGLIKLGGKYLIQHALDAIENFLNVLNLNTVINVKIILHDYIQQEEYLDALPNFKEENMILDEVVWSKIYSDIPQPQQDSILGLWTAFTELKGTVQNVFVLPCDAPFMSETVLSFIFNEYFKDSITENNQKFSSTKFRNALTKGQKSNNNDQINSNTYYTYVPRWNNSKFEPLFAIYNIKSMLPILEKEILKKDYSLQYILSELANEKSEIHSYNYKYRVKIREISIENELSKYDDSLNNFIDVNSVESLKKCEEIIQNQKRLKNLD